MVRRVHLQELLVGVEGLALLRHLYDGTDADAERRLAEVSEIMGDKSLTATEPIEEADARTGYAAWSKSYDQPGNPIVAIEEPAVWTILDRISPGRALDAACGTGRHGRHLAEAGHRVVGVDLSPQMLTRARVDVPALAQGDLVALPLPDGAFDVTVCGLALAHVVDLDRAVGELARVLGPGGRLVISVLHPFQAYLGWHAPFEDRAGRRGFVREHAHSHSGYLAAFHRAGLTVRGCVEPQLGAAEGKAKRRAFRHIPEAVVAAYEGLPGVLVWDVEKT
jgi:ubiquinone/menaquinone biosynthesis C-methylase UbiE